MARHTLDELDLSAMYPRSSLEAHLRDFQSDGNTPPLTESPESNGHPAAKRKLEVTIYVVKGYRIPVTDKFIELEPEGGALAGLAVADGSYGPYQISGVSVPFNVVSQTTLDVRTPMLVVYTPLAKDGRYYKNFFNRVVAGQVIDKATRCGLYPSPTGPFEMPASFALKTDSQKELASDLADWLSGNIATLVLTMPAQRGNIKKRDLHCVPPSFRSVCDTVNPCRKEVSLAYVTGKGYNEVARLSR